ncbi:MAG: metallophosphoesterase [Pirellulales bacterium]
MSTLIGIVSDTHGHLENTRAAIRMLETLEVQTVLHCGDIGTAEVAELFRPWPTHYVLGNVDAGPADYRAAIESAGGTLHGRFASLEIEGRRIAMLHGDDEKRLHESIAGDKYDLVCHGHTHVAALSRHGRTVVLNPGALYRAARHTIAVVKLPDLEITHVTV